MKGVRRARGTTSKAPLPGFVKISSQTSTLTASWASAATRERFQPSLIDASVDARKRVPILAPWAPSMRAAAKPLPSAIPPAARTGKGFTASTTCGTRTNVEILPPNPPASAPWAMITSAPRSAASRACWTVWTCCTKRPPAACTFAGNPYGSPSAMEITGACISTAMSKDSGWPCSQGWVKFTAKGRPVSSRIRRMLPRRSSAVRSAPPRLPKAPALETAAASAALLPKGPIPACMMG